MITFCVNSHACTAFIAIFDTTGLDDFMCSDYYYYVSRRWPEGQLRVIWENPKF